ncbi:STAS domain-containing protein [Sorangium sp. So ce1335]|uniref:STAS domain-containing protein n=1 Tax=Sorangium sp. So ce1335 TaxID=3133335 RepID=UPI003F5F098E
MNPASVLHEMRILVVDDNASIHNDFRRILKAAPSRSSLEEHEAELFGDVDAPRGLPAVELDVELTLAHQGEEGVELVRQARARGEPYAVAFVDFRMPPGIDGVETIHRMFDEDPDIQAVFCTAYTDLSWREIADRLSRVDRYLILKKPFEPMEVRQMAAALGAKWRHERERAMAHAALLEREAQLRALLDALPQGILRVDRRGRCLEARLPQGMAGGVAGAVPSSLEELVPPADAARAIELVRRAIDEGVSQRMESSVEGVEGRRHLDVRIAALGERSEAIVSLTDITELRQRQEQESLLREREIALQAQVDALGALSTPIVPISRHVVVVPLVGELDARRGESMRSALLAGIVARGTRTAILDVTGVPRMDEQMATELERTAGAVGLLGAEPVLTGLGPQAAQQLVALGISLTRLKTFLTLQEGVEFALRRRHKA